MSSGRDTLGCLTCRARKKGCSGKCQGGPCPECVKLGIFCGGYEPQGPGLRRNKVFIRKVKAALREYTKKLKLNGHRDRADDEGPTIKLMNSLPAGFEPHFGLNVVPLPASPATTTTYASGSASPPASTYVASDAFPPPMPPPSPSPMPPVMAQTFAQLNGPDISSHPHPAFYSFAQRSGLESSTTVSPAATLLSTVPSYPLHDGSSHLDTLEPAPTFFDVDSWINFDPEPSF